jgi:hypothetical protein
VTNYCACSTNSIWNPKVFGCAGNVTQSIFRNASFMHWVHKYFFAPSSPLKYPCPYLSTERKEQTNRRLRRKVEKLECILENRCENAAYKRQLEDRCPRKTLKLFSIRLTPGHGWFALRKLRGARLTELCKIWSYQVGDYYEHYLVWYEAALIAACLSLVRLTIWHLRWRQYASLKRR